MGRLWLLSVILYSYMFCWKCSQLPEVFWKNLWGFSNRESHCLQKRRLASSLPICVPLIFFFHFVAIDDSLRYEWPMAHLHLLTHSPLVSPSISLYLRELSTPVYCGSCYQWGYGDKCQVLLMWALGLAFSLVDHSHSLFSVLTEVSDWVLLSVGWVAQIFGELMWKWPF